MGWSESDLACNKHKIQNQNQNQNHKQLEGVCPFCLRERLSQLSSVQKKKASSMVAPSGSSSPAYSSASSSNAMSPVHHHRRRQRYHRNVSEIMGSISLMLSAGNYGLKKSRSIAFVPRNFVEDPPQLKHGKKKKGGFFSKLLHRERKKEILIYSRGGSMRESLG